MSRVNDVSCTYPTRVQTEHSETQTEQGVKEVQSEHVRTPDEKEQRLSQEKKSDMQLSGNMRQSELLATTKTASKQADKTEATQQVEKAIEESRANGGSHRDVVVAGAKADAGQVTLYGDKVEGEPRLREIFTNTGNQLKPKGQKYENGKPLLPTTPGNEKATSWCGIWATDIWKRSGVDCKWVVGKGPTGPDGKTLPNVAVTGNKDPKLKDIKPGDMIVINDYKADDPKKIKVGSTNHHAVVTETVYEVPGQSGKIMCPPNTVPENGKLVGLKTMNGNNPGVPGEDGRNPAIREAYVDLTTEQRQEDGSIRKLSGYYPLPEKK